MILMIMILVVASIMVIGITYFGYSQSSGNMSITPIEAGAMLSRDTSIVVLDVRTQDEYRSETGHLLNALLMPVQELESRADELAKLKDRTILVYCRSGNRSLQASKILSLRGFKVLNIEGGILRWRKDLLPVMNEK
jgi:rhodanese-related sulfurtransferase